MGRPGQHLRSCFVMLDVGCRLRLVRAVFDHVACYPLQHLELNMATVKFDNVHTHLQGKSVSCGVIWNTQQLAHSSATKMGHGFSMRRGFRPASQQKWGIGLLTWSKS